MTVTDQMGRTVEFNFPPKRIVSLVPSQSELLWRLGLQNELKGITKFCIHPEEMFRSVARVGGTKKIDIEKLKALQPDLIIGNKEENEQADIRAIEREFPVWMSDIYTLQDALNMITQVGAITNREQEARQLASGISEKHAAFTQRRTTPLSPVRAAYFIWKDPYMAAGKNNFIDHMLRECGLMNVFADEKFTARDFENANVRYPQVSIVQLQKENPQLVLLSSEPYPFKEKHAEELRQLCPGAKVLIVDGEFFSWYGSRLLMAFDYLDALRSQHFS